MAGGKFTILHHIFQRMGITPDEFLEKPRFIRVFCRQSMLVQLENEKQQAEALAQRRQQIQQTPTTRRGRRRR